MGDYLEALNNFKTYTSRVPDRTPRPFSRTPVQRFVRC